MNEPILIICRHVSDADPLVPGNTGGFRCANCHVDLQVSPAGMEKMAKWKDRQLFLLCNPCGLATSVTLDSFGVKSQTELHPAAQQALDEGLDNPLANYIREEQKGRR